MKSHWGDMSKEEKDKLRKEWDRLRFALLIRYGEENLKKVKIACVG